MQAERATVVELSEVRKSYRTAAGSVEALGGVTAALAAGTFTAVMGPSGSGKSTLLQCAAGLDSVTSGEVRIAGTGARPVPRHSYLTAHSGSGVAMIVTDRGWFSAPNRSRS